MTVSEFKREKRYHVLKLSDVAQLPAKHKQRLQQIEQAVFAIRKGKPLECVVVESDWPIYEATWQQVQAVAQNGPIIRDPSVLISAVCNAVEPSLSDSSLEDVARRVRSQSVHPYITADEAKAIGTAIDALSDLTINGGPSVNGCIGTLEDILTRSGYTTSTVHDETMITRSDDNDQPN